MENGGLELGDHPGGLCGTDLGGLTHLLSGAGLSSHLHHVLNAQDLLSHCSRGFACMIPCKTFSATTFVGPS